MEGPGFGSFLIAGKASGPPGAIEEPWGREAAPRLADGDGRDEGAIGRRILRHKMLQRLGHLMNGVRGHQLQSLSKLLIGDRNPLLGDLLKVRQKPWSDRLTRLPIDVRLAARSSDMNAMTPSSQDPTDSLDRCVLATTYLLVPGFDQRAVGLDHHGSRAVAIAEGEARAP